MADLAAGARLSLLLPAYSVLTVIASALGSGSIVPLDNPGTEPGTPIPVGTGVTKVIGPFAVPAMYRLVCNATSLSFGVAPVDFPTLSEAVAGAAASGLVVPVVGTLGDVVEMVGAGVPDATVGATVAGPGSRYTDITGAKLYINGGSKAVPAWKLVTSAA